MERRIFPRASVKLPANIDKVLPGQVVDLSETGLSFIIDRSLLSSKLQVKILLFQALTVNVKCKVIWKRYLFGESRFKYGVSFVDLEDKYISLIRKIICLNKGINDDYIKIAESFERFLKSIKNEFDEFDKKHDSKEQRIKFLEIRKKDISKKISDYLKKLWSHIEKLDKDNWNLYTHYLRAIANYLFIHTSQINDHFFKKPLGYPGDFMVMNYIIDYHRGAYLGDSSYEMLINHLACNIPIANSNIKRKQFFKNKILEIITKRENAQILSVGSGSSRELIELLNEGKLKKNFTFHCLDFEKKALNYVREEIRQISPKKKSYCNVNYINKNLIDLAKNKNLDGLLTKYDFIYCSGVFDYLKERIATRLIEILYGLLNKGGILILCNANNKDNFYRAAYEIMGDWVFYHREKDELMQWLKNINDAEEIKFDLLSDVSNYSFLSIKAKT